jgi:hypothetical protein
MVADES